MAIEEPEYKVLSKTALYEIRSYGPVAVAETKVATNFESAGKEAFRILAGYIFGGNNAKIKIAMTAPVSQEAASEKIATTTPVSQTKRDSGYIVQFTMPKPFTVETLPKPNDPRVTLRQLPPRLVAVYRYSGSWSEAHYKQNLALLVEALKKDHLSFVGEPVLARYDSPFKLWFLRRNEIWLQLRD